MADLKRRIKVLMRRVREAGQLPSSAVVVERAFQRLGYREGALRPPDVLERFNDMLLATWTESLSVLEEFGARSYARGIPAQLVAEYPEPVRVAEEIASRKGFAAGVTSLFAAWYPVLRECFLSVSQGRKQRGGKDFELQIERLLDLAHVPYEAQEVENRTDLILPSVAFHQRNRRASMVVSVKRTLRERWQEVAEELFNLRSPNVFLFTADEAVTRRHVERICNDYNIHLVVWDPIKEGKFPTDTGVLGYTTWATVELPRSRARWSP